MTPAAAAVVMVLASLVLGGAVGWMLARRHYSRRCLTCLSAVHPAGKHRRLPRARDALTDEMVRVVPDEAVA